MECLDELEHKAASSARLFDEPNRKTVERWQRIFGYSVQEAAARLTAQRQEFTALVSDSLQLVRQQASGHDRESFSHWLRLPRLNAVPASSGEKQSDRQYLLRLDGPLDSAETVAAIAGLPELPPPHQGSSADAPEDHETCFCTVSEDSKQAILQWVARNRYDYCPLFIPHSPAHKDFCAHSLYPKLGCDTTLPQHRLSGSSTMGFAAEPPPLPAQDECPVWYFFYGTLACAQKLRELLHHRDGSSEEEYELYPARVSRARLTSWGHYLGLKDGNDSVGGSAFLVQTKAQEATLMSYETSAYEVARCDITFDHDDRRMAGLSAKLVSFEPVSQPGVRLDTVDSVEGETSLKLALFGCIYATLVGSSYKAVPEV